jgi:hypothetical protein
LRCHQTFSGLRTFNYDATINIQTSGYKPVSTVTGSGSESLSSYTRWGTTRIPTSVETVYFKLGTLEAKPFIVRSKEVDFSTSSKAPTRQSTADEDPGLTSGAKVGIGVGAALGVLLLVALGLAGF